MSLKKLMVFGFFILCTVGTAAQKLSVKITSYPTAVLPSAPVRIEAKVRNISGKPIKLAYGYHGFSILAYAYKSDGTPLSPCGQEVSIKPTAGYYIKTKPTDWCEEIPLSPLCWPSEPGEYIVQIIVSSSGPYKPRGGEAVNTWSGKLKSEKLHIRILEPTGVDKEAYKYFKGFPLAHIEELLKQYPTSIYAGYALEKEGPGGSIQSASCITPKKRDQIWYVPTGDSVEKQNERREKIRKSYEEFVNKAKTFLITHTHFSQPEVLRKKLAIALFFLDRSDEAWKEVDKLSKLNGRWAEEAKAVLECKKKKQSEKDQK